MVLHILSTIILTQHTSPEVVTRKSLHCLSIKSRTNGKGIGEIIPSLLPKIRARLDELKVKKSGPVFIRYAFVDMPNRLDVEVGVITDTKLKSKGEIMSGSIPAGRYVSYDFYGHYSGLVGANGAVQAFAKDHSLRFMMKQTKSGDEFVGRYEIYETDPETTPDPSNWLTKVLYRIQ